MSDTYRIPPSVQQERYLDSIISKSSDAIITLDENLNILSWNRGAQNIYGYTPEEAVGRHITLIIPEDLKRQGELEHILSLINIHGAIQDYETVRQAKDGRHIHVQFTANRLFDEQGLSTGFISVIIRDITKRKELEQRLERKIHGLFIINEIGRAFQRTTDLDEILYIVLVGVTAGQTLKFNRAFLFLINEERTLLEGRMAIGPSSPEEAGRIWTDLSDKRLTLNDILRPYRRETSLQDTWINERVRQISIPLTDTTHILTQALTTHTSYNISDASHHGGVSDDFFDQIGSRAFAVVPLFSQEKSIGVLLADNLITGRPILDEDVELLEIFAQQASATLENSFLYQTLAQQVRALEEANHNLKLYQEKLIHAERLSAIGQMATTVAHEIRNPLVSIGGFAHLLWRQTPVDSPHREYLDIIKKEGMRLEKIVTEVLDLARPIHMTNEPHDMNRLIREALQVVMRDIHSKRLRVEERLLPDLPPVPMDTDHIKQVLLNLIKNAIEASPARGCLTIWTSAPGPAYIEVGIADTGSGIETADMEHIFEPFFTTKPGGSGLGLTVASRIVHDHGGTLDVSGQAGEGATFLIHLPIKSPEEPEEPVDLERVDERT